MYHVKFWNQPNGLDLPFAVKNVIAVEDLERALAVASLLQKVSTPNVKFEAVEVVPFNPQENETEKK